jgi:peptide chain release factor 2
MLADRIAALRAPLQLEKTRDRVAELERIVADQAFWDNPEVAAVSTAELARLQRLLKRFDDAETFAGMEADLSPDEYTEAEALVRALENETLLSGAHDSYGALVSIHAGTGGTDAMDWAEMLLRMFLRYAESGKTEAAEDRALGIDRSDWQVEMITTTKAEEAGIKAAVFQVRGAYAFGLLRSEHGVHRLVRQSPFNAKGLRQTSFALVEVLPELPVKEAPVIQESELSIDVFRSGGAGGQHVNTTDSAVRITHIPSGITVTVQNERSQHQNKATALSILQSRLAALQLAKTAEEVSALKGDIREGSWGNQIRSYVLHPYQLVKDHRTDAETSDTTGVLNGDLPAFIEAFLRYSASTNQ